MNQKEMDENEKIYAANRAGITVDPPVKEKFGLKGIRLKQEPDNPQVIFAHKQIDRNHFVFTHGIKENSKLRCFRMEPNPEPNSYHFYEYTDPAKMAQIARLMGIDDLPDPEPTIS